MELNLGRGVKGSKKKGLYRYISNKRKARKNMGVNGVKDEWGA